MKPKYPITSLFSIPLPSYESCCWIKVVSPDTGKGARAWNMQTDIDVTRRPDGKINSSPVTAAIPIEKYRLGCTYDLKIAGQSERKSIWVVGSMSVYELFCFS